MMSLYDAALLLNYYETDKKVHKVPKISDRLTITLIINYPII